MRFTKLCRAYALIFLVIQLTYHFLWSSSKQYCLQNPSEEQLPMSSKTVKHIVIFGLKLGSRSFP